ncbi:MAG: insulinase family protein [Holosporaceae bacterium]|jgi:predicted Zn-dependent peptidase|nr:insulinase family protein [Holosporaceae bacterium]
MSPKIIISFIFVVLVSTSMFFKKEKPFIKVSEVSNNCGIKTHMLRVKSDNVIYVKCKFKNAGVLHNSPEKHGISAVIAELLCRKINGLSPQETREKLLELGVINLFIRAFEDHFVLSFYVLKDKVSDALKFLSPIFSRPEFSKNDLEFIKEKYPIILDTDASHPQELLFDKLMGILYQNHNYGLNNTGTARAISSITEHDVRDFIKSNFSKDKLEVFFTGDLSSSETETYIEILFSKLAGKNQEASSNATIASSGLSEEKSALIHKKNMENIAGVMSGIRLDKLNDREKAALYIIVETLFNEKTGDFCLGLRSHNMAYEVNCAILRRSYSSVFYFFVYIDKGDLINYKKYLKDKISAYQNKLNINDLKRTQNHLVAQTKDGFADITDIDEKIKFNSLPFSEVTEAIFAGVAKKLFDESQMRTVCICSD